MIHTLIQPLFILVLATLVFFGFEAASAIAGRDTLKAICFGLVAILALIYIVMTLFGL